MLSTVLFLFLRRDVYREYVRTSYRLRHRRVHACVRVYYVHILLRRKRPMHLLDCERTQWRWSHQIFTSQ